MLRKLVLLVLFVVLTGCASYIPEQEIAIAQVAVDAARSAKADVQTPQLFQRVEYTLREAKRARKNRNFDIARRLAIRAKQLAEKAENKSVLKREIGE